MTTLRVSDLFVAFPPSLPLQTWYNQAIQMHWTGKRGNAPRPWPKGVDPVDVHDSTIPAKACSRCGVRRPLDGYAPDTRASDGRQSACRECTRAEGRSRYAARRAAWLAEHPKVEEVERACSRCGAVKPIEDFTNGRRCRACRSDEYRMWAAREAVRRADYMRRWRAENRDRVRATTAAWRADNADRVRDYQRARSAADPDSKRARIVAWRKKNAARVREYGVAYRAAHPDEMRARYAAGAAVRRARKAAAPVVERIYRAKVWERDGGRCHICGRKADPHNWHLEHIVPLSVGGEHSYRNVAVSHPACNLRKGVLGAGQQRLLP